MKKLVCLTILFLFSFTLILLSANTEAGSYQPSCDTSKTTVCTIEMWLAHKHKKNNREIRKFLKSKKYFERQTKIVGQPSKKLSHFPKRREKLYHFSRPLLKWKTETIIMFYRKQYLKRYCFLFFQILSRNK